MLVTSTNQKVHPYVPVLGRQMPSARDTAFLIKQELDEFAETPVEATNPEATVLILDRFEQNFPDQPSHGEHVKSVFLNQGTPESKIQTAEHDGSTLWSYSLLDSGPESASERLHAFIEFSAAETVEKTRLAVEKWTGPDSTIKTINQSSGNSGAALARFLLDTSLKPNENGEPELTKTGHFLYEGLGRPTTLVDMQQRLLDKIDDVLVSSEVLAGSQARLAETLARFNAEGGSYFAAAGNYQSYIDGIREQGIPVSDRLTKSVLSVPNAQIVGALDTKGTLDTSDDEIADFSARDGNVRYVAPGVDIPLQVGTETILTQGTSIASPYVAAHFESKRSEYPFLPSCFIHQLLSRNADVDCPHSPVAII